MAVEYRNVQYGPSVSDSLPAVRLISKFTFAYFIYIYIINLN